MSSRRGSSLYGFIGLTIIGALMSTAAPASACESVDLFKIVTVRDETIVGVTEQDYAALQGHDVSAIGRALADNGALTLWQYAVRKASDGALELAPLQRISLLRHDSLRVEPYATPLRVLAAPEEGIEREPQPRC
jgi:hypothetical protein